MRIKRKCIFTRDEVESITKAALVDAAINALGEPNAGELAEVDLCSYSDSTVEIVRKPEPAQQEPERPAPPAIEQVDL